MRATGLIALGLLGCATAPPAPSSPERTRASIEEGNRLLAAAMLVANPERVAMVFTDDATILPFRSPGFVQGHAAIIEYFRKRFATTRFLEVELKTLAVDVSGELAYEVGTSRVRSQTGDAAPVTSTGRYLVVWRRGADSNWRIQADCPIPDPPPPDAAPSSR